MKANGETVDAIAKELKVSLATARTFLTGLALARTWRRASSTTTDRKWPWNRGLTRSTLVAADET
jgi:hypothetical protein